MAVIAVAATTFLRLPRKLRRVGSPPKLGERRRKQIHGAANRGGLLRFARNAEFKDRANKKEQS